MNAESILKKIEDDALAAAEKLINDANDKADNMRESEKKAAELARMQARDKAHADVLQMEERMRRMAQLDLQKKELAAKRMVLDECYAQAKQTICRLPAEQLRQLFLKHCVQYASGGEELLCGADNSGWFDAGFMTELNAKLASDNREPCALSGEVYPNVTGAVLRKQGTEVHLTIESMLSEERQTTETEVARVLFDA